eukprot:scaffold184524_cov34-Tisochrysis_lutea.AAC.2
MPHTDSAVGVVHKPSHSERGVRVCSVLGIASSTCRWLFPRGVDLFPLGVPLGRGGGIGGRGGSLARSLGWRGGRGGRGVGRERLSADSARLDLSLGVRGTRFDCARRGDWPSGNKGTSARRDSSETAGASHDACTLPMSAASWGFPEPGSKCLVGEHAVCGGGMFSGSVAVVALRRCDQCSLSAEEVGNATAGSEPKCDTKASRAFTANLKAPALREFGRRDDRAGGVSGGGVSGGGGVSVGRGGGSSSSADIEAKGSPLCGGDINVGEAIRACDGDAGGEERGDKLGGGKSSPRGDETEVARSLPSLASSQTSPSELTTTRGDSGMFCGPRSPEDSRFADL